MNNRAGSLLSRHNHSPLCLFCELGSRISQHCKPRFATAATVRKGSPRPDAAEIEERRSERAEGGRDFPSAPKSSLFALEVKAKRHNAEDLRLIQNRFPLQDRFALSNGRSVGSNEILAVLDGSVAPDRLEKIRQVVAGRTFGVVPLLEGIYDRGNIGAVARSADALGFGALHYVKTLDPRRLKSGSGKRTSGGSQKWLDMQVWDTVSACLKHLKAAGYFIAATHLSPESLPITELDWTRPTVIILGNESYGVSHEALSFADQPVIIPQAPGFVDSFNVSVAAALTLYEARSSRIRAVGRNGDLTEEQQRILTAAMLLRHKEYNEVVRRIYGLSLEDLEALHMVVSGEERLWQEKKKRRNGGR